MRESFSNYVSGLTLIMVASRSTMWPDCSILFGLDVIKSLFGLENASVLTVSFRAVFRLLKSSIEWPFTWTWGAFTWWSCALKDSMEQKFIRNQWKACGIWICLIILTVCSIESDECFGVVGLRFSLFEMLPFEPIDFRVEPLFSKAFIMLFILK